MMIFTCVFLAVLSLSCLIVDKCMKKSFKNGYNKGIQDATNTEYVQVFTSVEDLANYLTQERH